MKKHRLAPRFVPKRSTVAVALALCLGALGTDAFAFGFGEPEVSSALGQPLQMRVALQPDPSVDLSPQCLHLLGSPRDPLPTLTAAKLTIEDKGPARFLRIESLNAIDEPILRVIVDAGCVQHMRREFTVLLDPPVAQAPSAALAPAMAATLTAAGTSNVAPPDATISTELASTAALDLGVARIHGRIGEPLAMEVPITGSAAAEVDNASLRAVQVLSSDGTPLRHALQASLTRSDASTLLQIVTGEPIAEPALRVVVEVVTAHASVRREYGVLLDMPAPPPKAAETPALDAPAAAAPAAQHGDETKAPSPDAQAEPPPAPAAPAPEPKPAPKRKHVHRSAKPATPPMVAEAPRNAPLAAPAAPPAPAQTPEKAEPKGGAAQGTGTDHLQLSTPVDDAAVKRFAEMDRRVQDLTQEIVKLRGDLALQKEREAELVAQAARPGGSWLAAVGGAFAVVVGALVLWTRRRSSAQGWNPATWDGATHTTDGRPTAGPGAMVDTRMTPGSASEPSSPAGSAAEFGRPSAAGLSPLPGARTSARPVNTVGGADPITISPLTTPIEVTEVLANEPSIEQLYTLFYDIGSNTTPGGKPGPGALPKPSTVLPPVSLPKTEQLDINLGIPESVQSARAARAQGAMKLSATTAATPKGDVPPAPAFSYTGNALPGRTLESGKLDVATNVGPLTEIPRDGDFPKTQPGLDLDLSTQPGLVTRFGPPTEMPRDEQAGPPAPASAPGTPAGLDLDLSTSLGGATQIGPLTEIPRDDEEPKTQVALDLNLNTNVALDPGAEAAERESDPFAITTIPGSKG